MAIDADIAALGLRLDGIDRLLEDHADCIDDHADCIEALDVRVKTFQHLGADLASDVRNHDADLKTLFSQL